MLHKKGGLAPAKWEETLSRIKSGICAAAQAVATETARGVPARAAQA
jgi:hypothetical protein